MKHNSEPLLLEESDCSLYSFEHFNIQSLRVYTLWISKKNEGCDNHTDYRNLSHLSSSATTREQYYYTGNNLDVQSWGIASSLKSTKHISLGIIHHKWLGVFRYQLNLSIYVTIYDRHNWLVLSVFYFYYLERKLRLGRFSELDSDGPSANTSISFRTVWTQLAYLFNWRTAKPLGPSPAPG